MSGNSEVKKEAVAPGSAHAQQAVSPNPAFALSVGQWMTLDEILEGFVEHVLLKCTMDAWFGSW
jgi:hypothetical protein